MIDVSCQRYHGGKALQTCLTDHSKIHRTYNPIIISSIQVCNNRLIKT